MNSNGYQISPTSILYIDEKGKIEVQNDTNLNTLAVGTYIIKMGDSEYKQQFSLGGLYAVYAIATNKSYFVSNNYQIQINLLIVSNLGYYSGWNYSTA